MTAKGKGRRSATPGWVTEIAQLRQEVAQLRSERVRFIEVPVDAVNTGNSTFTALVPVDGETQLVPLSGIPAAPQFVPEVGGSARLALAGPQVIHQPNIIGENAITDREISDGAIGPAQLSFNIESLRGTTIFYGPDTPVTDKADLWLKTPENIAYRFNTATDTWEMVRDQGIAQALLDATNANNAAVTAGNAALAAQQTADVKTTTFNQISAPTTTGRTLGDLWIDTDDGNKRYVWTGAWTASALGAAALVATARQLGAVTTYRQATAPASGMIVGDFWIDSDDNKLYRYEGSTPTWVASQDVGIQTALTNAGNAATAAASKTTTYYQTSQPATTGRATGDLWVDTDDGFKIWAWNGSAWTASLLGAAAIGATARQLGAITTYRQATAPASGMIVGDFWIDSDDNVIYRYEGTTPTWVKSQDININAAITAAATAQSTADGKMKIYPQTSPPTGLTALDAGDLWIDTDDSNVSYTWTWTTSGTWTKRQLGNGAITPQSLVASNVIATGTVTAALLEALMVLATVLVAGDPNGDHTKIGASGVVAYINDPNDGVPNEVARFGRTSGGTDANGKQVWKVDETGAATFSNLTVTGDPRLKGDLLSTHLDRKAQIVAWTFKWPSPGSTTNEVGLVELSFKARKGHAYVVRATGLYADVAGADNQTVPFRLRATFDGSRPTITSQMMETANVNAKFDIYPWENDSGEITNLHFAGSDQTVRYLLTVAKPPNATSVAYWADYTYHASFMYVEDMGLTPGDTGQPNTGNGTLLSGGTASAPAAAKQDGETLFYANWVSSFSGANTLMNYLEAYQGYNPAYTPNGQTRSFIGFPDMTGSLAGATIRYAKVWLWYGHWYRSDGGYPVVGVHGNLNKVTTPVNQFALNQPDVPWLGRGAGAWIELPASWLGGIQNGTYRGIALGPGPNGDGGYAGRANGVGQSNQPILAVGWTR